MHCDQGILDCLRNGISLALGTTGHREPGLAAYLIYCTAFAIRYFLVTGLIYTGLNVLFRRGMAAYRIQAAAPPREHVRHDVLWSLLNIAGNGVSAIFLFFLIDRGHTQMYFAVSAHGWPYFLASTALVVLGYDTWNYWQHRLLHTEWMFHHIHHQHHVSTNPTALTTFAQHPVETLFGNTYFLLMALTVPLHPAAMAIAGGYMFATGVISHTGFEFYPRGFTRHPLFGWINTATHHNLHHHIGDCNYSSWFNFWDWAMGTNHASYHDAFEATRAHVARSRARSPHPAPARGTEVLAEAYPSIGNPHNG